MDKISVTLTSAHMGPEADEGDFLAWQSWVCDKIDEAMGFEVHEVGLHRFGDACEDTVVGGTEEQRTAIKSWLAVDGWEQLRAHLAKRVTVKKAPRGA